MARPAIPESIKRAVRQRCGFGCVICGCPIYDYDHIEEYSAVQEHSESNLTLLCDHHHRRKTAKLLPIEMLKHATDNPHNKKTGVTKPEILSYYGQALNVSVGGNTFKYFNLPQGRQFFPFVVDGLPIISFTNEDNVISLSAVFHDHAGNICFQINQNELICNTDQWDIEWVGKTLTIRTEARRILLEVEFSPPGKIEVKRADLRFNGVELVIGEDHIYCLNDGSFFSGNAISEYGTAFAIGASAPSDPAGIVVQVPRQVTDRKAAERRLSDILNARRKEKRVALSRCMKQLLGSVSILTLISYGMI